MAPIREVNCMVQGRESRKGQQGRKELLEGGEKDKDRAGSLAEGVLWERPCATPHEYPSLLSFRTAWLCERCGVFPNLAGTAQAFLQHPVCFSAWQARAPPALQPPPCLLACCRDLCFPVSSLLWENVNAKNTLSDPVFKNSTVILHWMRHVKNWC